jgi:hypothetical protein
MFEKEERKRQQKEKAVSDGKKILGQGCLFVIYIMAGLALACQFLLDGNYSGLLWWFCIWTVGYYVMIYMMRRKW